MWHAIGMVLGIAFLSAFIASPILALMAWLVTKPYVVRKVQFKRMVARWL
jgi:hypothetical protein